MKKVIKQLMDSINDRLKDDKGPAKPLFSDKRYESLPIISERFNVVDTVEPSDSKILFVDGGNTELLPATNISLQLIRVYGTIYENNKRVGCRKHEAFLLTDTHADKGNLHYRSRFFSIDDGDDDHFLIFKDIGELNFDSMDPSIAEGKHRARIGRVAEAMRRFTEIALAKEMVDTLDEGDFIVLDGTLHAGMTHETHHLDSLYEAADSKKVITCGLAKTSRLFTDDGDSLQNSIMKIAPKDIRWYYHPLVKTDNPEHKAEISIVKLNDRSRHIFRLETHVPKRMSGDVLKKIFHNLAANSVDAAFPGYPYGLIDADRFARVTDREKEMFMTKLRYHSKDGWGPIRQLMSSIDAHDILDNM